jgi:hypothetical protein
MEIGGYIASTKLSLLFGVKAGESKHFHFRLTIDLEVNTHQRHVFCSR